MSNPNPLANRYQDASSQLVPLAVRHLLGEGLDEKLRGHVPGAEEP